MLERFARLGMPWVFGTDAPAALLAARGWSSDVHTVTAVSTAFGRAPATPEGGPDGYLVHATR
ncbi:hypothetical protein Acsp06_14210 [Actinomycetospora sp. NBRC 106375]|uniref:hypothetical protein n=1 Tax=Actinomycetospora sp. NBRC 106375 TaxID=3032207 RepID=UPI0024A458B9|nr:hypothetical protein [Actinomycetospora sp. NBRC 106375]GLZ45236.1 hypothetical protein Acsp06_14210 [Actinomycetospora sp. NBRC 106375]